MIAAPRRRPGRVEVGGEPLTVDRPERELSPAMLARQRLWERIARVEPDRTRLERMPGQLPTQHPAVEQDRVHREAGEAETQAVDDRDDRDRLHLDAGLLVHLLHRDLCR